MNDLNDLIFNPALVKREINYYEDLYKDIVNNTNWFIEKILIWEYEVINNIIEQILWNIDLENRMTKINIRYHLEKYINNNTYFYYDKKNKAIIWVGLDETELKELISKIGELILSDKRLTIKWWINSKKRVNEDLLRKRRDQKNQILLKINKLTQELYRIESSLYILEDKWSSTLVIETERNIIQNNLKAEESKIIEIDQVILNIKSKISFLNEKLNELKWTKWNFNIDNEAFSKIFEFNIPDYILPKKVFFDDIEKKMFSDMIKKWKNIVYPLSVLVWLGFFLKTINDYIPQENKITPYGYSDQFKNNIPEPILEDVNKWRLREVSGFEKYFIIWTDTFPINVVYEWDTLEEDIILNTIKLTFIDLNWIRQEPKTLYTYFYRKDIDKGIKIIINDASVEGQTINLSIKK